MLRDKVAFLLNEAQDFVTPTQISNIIGKPELAVITAATVLQKEGCEIEMSEEKGLKLISLSEQWKERLASFVPKTPEEAAAEAEAEGR